MAQPIRVTFEFAGDVKDPDKHFPEALLALGAGLERVTDSPELTRYFPIPAGVPVEVEIRQVAPQREGGARGGQTLRIIIDAPREHADKIRKAVEGGLPDALTKHLPRLAPTARARPQAFAADAGPAALEFVFK